jgi:hypothetical protein
MPLKLSVSRIILAQELSEALLPDELAVFVRCQAVLGKTVVKHIKDVGAKLLQLLLEI